MSKYKIKERNLDMGKIYFENENDDREKDCETVHSSQIVPNVVILFISHP